MVDLDTVFEHGPADRGSGGWLSLNGLAAGLFCVGIAGSGPTSGELGF